MGLIKRYSETILKGGQAHQPHKRQGAGSEEEYSKLTDAQFPGKTPEFKQRLANGETLDDILPEALPPAVRLRGVF